LNKILGKEIQQKPVQEFVIKRRDRKWIVGGNIATDGSVMNSIGLVKLQELKQTIDSMPVNFNFEKKILK